MRAILVYWVLGCLLLGISLERLQVKCPGDRIKMAPEVALTFVAIWPASLSAGLAGWAHGTIFIPQVGCAAGGEQ